MRYNWPLVLVAVILLTLCTGTVSTDSAQINHPAGILTIEQKLNATEEEARLCYFALGTGRGALVLSPSPKSDVCVYFRAHVGQRMRATFVPLVK